LGGGIGALPGVRATEGNFPFWLTVDNRLMADEFFRPSYTMGIWAKGKAADRLSYHFMNRQGAPTTDAFENVQIRLSDGNPIFTPSLFGSGIQVDNADYQMFCTGISDSASTGSPGATTSCGGMPNTCTPTAAPWAD